MILNYLNYFFCDMILNYLEILQIAAADNPVEVHLFEDVERRQLLTSLVLEQRGQHARPLLTCRGEDGADQCVLQRGQSLFLGHYRLVRQLVVALGSLDELPPEI